jgi:uncharacterized protein
LYADAYRMTGHLKYRKVFDDVIRYVLRDLRHPQGGFYAAEDADSEGEEGKFYVWSPDELKKVLGEDAPFACEAYGVTSRGNFENGMTVLYRAKELTPNEEGKLEKIREELMRARTGRQRPARDENILSGWNALMIQGLFAAYQATGEDGYVRAGVTALDFIQKELTAADGSIYRAWNNGTAKVKGFLDDHAYLANAFLDAYESTFQKKYLFRAKEIVDIILREYWDEGLYFTAKAGEQLVHRPRAPHDNACPSGLSTSIFALLRIHELFGEQKYLEHADQLLLMYGEAAEKNPFGFAHFLAALEFRRNSASVILTGTIQQEFVAAVHRSYLPNKVLARAEDVQPEKVSTSPKTISYVCRRQVCFPPVEEVGELLQVLRQK